VALLFNQAVLQDLLDDMRPALAREVEDIPPERLLDAPEHDLCAALVEKYRVEIPILHPDGMFVRDEGEADLGPQHYPHARGHRLTVAIPFEGDPQFLRYRPSSFSGDPPRADIVGQELWLPFQAPQLTANEVQREVQHTLHSIEDHLSTAREDVKPFNRSLPGLAEDAVRRRKERLLRQRGTVEALGIPVRHRADAPRTYALPVKRRVPTIESIPTTSQPYSPEPALAVEEYERILDIVHNMALVMERSPSAFERMHEEHLRDHFLVQLNGQYEGAAAGEVFNCAGKTDILIRWETRNVFIAECKFWTGPKGFHEALDQLLSYTSWRDTKTALFLFNRHRALSRVLARVPDLLRAHPCWKRDVPQAQETRFRSTMQRPDDAMREVTVTVCVFSVPSVSSAAPPV
jgi:hypothetical protein